MRSAAAAPESRPDLWSAPSLVTGSTLARQPDQPPRMCPGCFETVVQPDTRDVIVYWTKTEPRYHNGPNFKYVVRRIQTKYSEDDETVVLNEEKVESSYVEFRNMDLITCCDFSVTSRNDEGEAAKPPYSFNIGPQETLDDISPQSVTVIYSEASSQMSVSWLRPPGILSGSIQSYTVFWCERKRFTDTFCQTYLQFEDVHPDNGEHASSSTLAMASDSSENTLIYQLNLPADKEYKIAVAANVEGKLKMSSGMIWSSCEIVNDEMSSGWVREVNVERVGAGWMEVRWRLPCSQRTGLVLSYNVTWCEGEGGTREPCESETVRHSQLTNTHKITGLAAWTPYTITVTAVSRDPAREALPSFPLVQWTEASTPASEPLDLKTQRVTNMTVDLSWRLPVRANGPTNWYKV